MSSSIELAEKSPVVELAEESPVVELDFEIAELADVYSLAFETVEPAAESHLTYEATEHTNACRLAHLEDFNATQSLEQVTRGLTAYLFADKPGNPKILEDYQVEIHANLCAAAESLGRAMLIDGLCEIHTEHLTKRMGALRLVSSIISQLLYPSKWRGYP